jgi:hypothetical protein
MLVVFIKKMSTINSCDTSLPVGGTQGGTNNSSFTPNMPLYSTGTSITTVASGVANNVLTSNGPSSAPTFQSLVPLMTLVSTQSSAVATGAFIFPSMISSARYFLNFSGVSHSSAVSDNLVLFMGTSSSTYLTTGYTSGNNSYPYGSITITNTNSTTNGILTPAFTLLATSINGYLHAYFPANGHGSYCGTLLMLGWPLSSYTVAQCFGSVSFGVGSSITSLKISFLNTNISGSISLYQLT